MSKITVVYGQESSRILVTARSSAEKVAEIIAVRFRLRPSQKPLGFTVKVAGHIDVCSLLFVRRFDQDGDSDSEIMITLGDAVADPSVCGDKECHLIVSDSKIRPRQDEEKEEELCLQLKKVSVSASSLNSSDELSSLCLPYGPHCFFHGHKRIKMLLADVDRISEADAQRLEPLIPQLYSTSFHIPASPENLFCRPNLEVFLKGVVATMEGHAHRCFSVVNNVDVCGYFSPYLTSASSRPECCVVFEDVDRFRCGAIASEAKGVAASALEALSQAVALASDFATDQMQKGLSCQDIVVVFVLAFGDSLQFGCVYLMEPSFPCCTMLSKPLSVLTWDDRTTIAKWAVALGMHCSRLSQLLTHRGAPLAEYVQPMLRGRVHLVPIVCEVSNESSFRATQLLGLFQLLHEHEPCHQFVAFPLGQIGMPNNKQARDEVIGATIPALRQYASSLAAGFPFLVFSKLCPDWNNCENGLENFLADVGMQTELLQAVKEVFSSVSAAGLVCLDGQLCNFFYHCTDSAPSRPVRIKLVGWAYARRQCGLPLWAVKRFSSNPDLYPASDTPIEDIHGFFIGQIAARLILEN